ncbi:GGDEF domain-containing protein [Piscinibacter sp.]|uniref:GGDEF domain-containing protein n=1 Tax=Piscinibacter sp. TaxID=1903157 RepID=UPI002C4B5288|nr:GGDEF domain-containing protein [Albitalea sp.]HUG22990.1 GGDEF domain-containing protein [Albitalea sp.]
MSTALPRVRSGLRACAAGLLLACASVLAAPEPMDRAEQIAALDHRGATAPREAAHALDRLLPMVPPFSAERLELLTVRGLLLASTAEPEAAERVAQALDDWGRARADAAAAAAALLVRARVLWERGNLQQADELLTEARARLPAGLPARTRLRYTATHANVKDEAGKLEAALQLSLESAALADETGDDWRRAVALTNLAYVYYETRQLDRASQANAQALDIATQAQDDTALGHVYNIEGFLLGELGDRDGERRAMQAAIDHARRAGAKSDEALYLANMADYHLKAGDYRTALALSEQALPLVRELKDVSGETVALANIGLAQIALRNIETGKRFVAESIAIDERRGSVISVATTLEELGHHLEKAGDAAAAVQAYHRHRRISDEILQRDQQKAIIELQERFDAERRTRDLVLLNRENALKDEQLRQRDLQQRLWWLVAAGFVLSLVVLLLLYRRVRRSNQALESSNYQLLVQSERDPLTGLANRRHFQAAMKQLAADGKLNGTVFLIDIDHFKRINDAHGHAAGDTVLAQMAQRLRDTLRDQDLIVRWGGEEFLVVVHTLSPDQVEVLAQRMLDAMGAVPVMHGGAHIDVTGSIGFATFPIEPLLLAVSWERAINLVDTAMYLAKAHGRNRAYGVRLLHAREESVLDDITRSLETAWREGKVALTLLQGPSGLRDAVA